MTKNNDGNNKNQKSNRLDMIANFIVPFIIMFCILFIVIMLVVNVLFRNLKDEVQSNKENETIALTNTDAEVSTNSIATNTNTSTTTTNSDTDAVVTYETIEEKADVIVKALKTQDMVTVAKYVSSHPKAGLRFSNSYNVQVKTDKFFTRDQVATLATDPNKYTWGAQDGTGNSIVVTGKEYLTQYVYTSAFAETKTITYNGFAKTSNTINNTRAIYPKSFMVEYTTEGDNPEFDWKSLLLIFEEDGQGAWYLSGIAKNGWTI